MVIPDPWHGWHYRPTPSASAWEREERREDGTGRLRVIHRPEQGLYEITAEFAPVVGDAVEERLLVSELELQQLRAPVTVPGLAAEVLERCRVGALRLRGVVRGMEE